MDLLFPLAPLSAKNKNEFEDIQWKAWGVAAMLNPNSKKFGFNINSTYQNEIYGEHDNSDQDEAGDLTWDNFVKAFPEYIPFLNKHHFYHGCTMISRAVEGPHRHGFGELTYTYPLQGCEKITVQMVKPVNEEDAGKWWLNNNEQYDIIATHKCVNGNPFMIAANNFHKTSEPPDFINGHTIFTVWHSIISNKPEHYPHIIRMMNYLQFPLIEDDLKCF